MSNRWSLPLENRSLDVYTDMARVTLVPVQAGEKPWLELRDAQEHVAPGVQVDEDGDRTRVRISGLAGDHGAWWSGPWWEAMFWKKAFRSNVVLHVPVDVRGRLRSNASRMHIEHLRGCDLDVETDAGSLTVDSVTGRLRLATQAGRIEAKRIGGALDLSTSAGAIFADVVSLCDGTHPIRTNVGAVRLELARELDVRIEARTSMGATRIEFPSSDDAPAVLDIEADLGAIRVTKSSRPAEVISSGEGPYRTAWTQVAAHPTSDEEIERILSRVADGSITPEAARDLLRELGVT